MNESTEITATFWDCGGVLLTNGWDHVARRHVCEHFHLDFEDFERRHEAPNDQWERGRITLAGYLDQTVFYTPRDFTPDEFIAQMRAASRPLYPRMIEFLGELRAHRDPRQPLGIYMLSNESRELMAWRIRHFGLAPLFDAFLVSAYIGLRKPEAAFFQCALEITQRRPDRCIFIDDREENIAGARAAGIKTIRFESPQQTIAALGQQGIDAQ